MFFCFCAGLWARLRLRQPHRLKLDETNRKLPLHTSSSALLQKKEEARTGPCRVSCRVNRRVSPHPPTCGSPAVFGSGVRRSSSHTSALLTGRSGPCHRRALLTCSCARRLTRRVGVEGGEEEEEERSEKGDRKKKNEGGNCSVGRNPPSPFPGEEVD